MTYLKILLVSLTVIFNLTIHATQASERESLLQDDYSTLLGKIHTLDPKEHNEGPVNEVLQTHPVTLSWCDILKIWGKNALQFVNIGDWMGCAGMAPLSSCSRSSYTIVQYFEDRVGYAIAPVNFVCNWQLINKEGPETMIIRGLWKKYNLELLRQKLIAELSQKKD